MAQRNASEIARYLLLCWAHGMPCATCRANHSTLSFPCLCVAPSQLSLRYSAVPLRYSAVLCGTHVSTGSAEEEGAHRTLSDGSVVRATKAGRPSAPYLRYSQAGGSHACIASSTTRLRRYGPLPPQPPEPQPPECLASLYWLAQLTRDRGWYVRMASLEQTAFESVSPCAQARNECTPKQIPNRLTSHRCACARPPLPPPRALGGCDHCAHSAVRDWIDSAR